MNFLECKSELASHSKFLGSKNPKINAVARGFVENYDRIIMMLHLPQHTAYNGIVLQHNWMLARGDAEKYNELQNSGKGVDETRAPRLRALADKVVTIAESPSSLMSDPVHKGLEALLASTLIAAWTAFETLAADLWEAALNERPRLAFIALGVEPDSSDSKEEESRKREKKLSFPAWMLLDPDFDLRNEMGTAVSKMRKWDFARRDRAASAYRAVFRSEQSEIDKVFKDPQLGWLAATRNAVVHSAAHADDEFLKLTGTHPEFKSLERGNRIRLSGDVVGKLASSAFIQGNSLLKIVDDWVAANPR